VRYGRVSKQLRIGPWLADGPKPVVKHHGRRGVDGWYGSRAARCRGLRWCRCTNPSLPWLAGSHVTRRCTRAPRRGAAVAGQFYLLARNVLVSHFATPQAAPAETKPATGPGRYTAEQVKALPARQYLDELIAPALFEGMRRLTRERYGTRRCRRLPQQRPMRLTTSGAGAARVGDGAAPGRWTRASTWASTCWRSAPKPARPTRAPVRAEQVPPRHNRRPCPKRTMHCWCMLYR